MTPPDAGWFDRPGTTVPADTAPAFPARFFDTAAAAEPAPTTTVPTTDAQQTAVCFELTFPADLTPKHVLAFVHATSGLLVSGPARLFGVRSCVLELWATDTGFSYRLRAPRSYAEFLANQLRTLIPGASVTPLQPTAPPAWTTAVELGLRSPRQTLHVPDPAAVSTSLLASLREIRRGETCCIQWVLSPALHERPPAPSKPAGSLKLFGKEAPAPAPDDDRLSDQRDKLSGPNMLGVLRIAVATETDQRAKHLLASVQTALASVRNRHNSFRPRMVPKAKIIRHLDRAQAPLLYPCQLTASEVVALLGWPIGSPLIAGLPQVRTRHLPATEAIQRTGRVLAVSNFPGSERPLALSQTDSCKHLHVCGPTGTGKTVLLANLAAQDMATGCGVVVIEAKGGSDGLFARVLERVPAKRLDDVIILDITDAEYPVGFNILNQGQPRVVVEELCRLFEYLYRDTRGVWTREVLYHGLSTLVTKPENTFVDLAPLLVPLNEQEEAWRDHLVQSLTDRELKNFWQRFLGQPSSAQLRIAQPVMDRIWQLNARPEIRHIIGQSSSSFTMNDVVRHNKVLLVNLAGLGKDTASLAGTLLMHALWRAIQGTPHQRPLFLYLDEFQDFLQLPIDPADLFAKARSFRMGITAAHQDLGQLPVELRQAVLANARSKVVFQTAADDARTFAREFGRSVSDEDFLHLGQFQVLMRVATSAGVSQPVTGLTNPPSPTTGLDGQARNRSRQRYGRPLAEVEAAIEARRTSVPVAPKKRPKLGSTSWD